MPLKPLPLVRKKTHEPIVAAVAVIAGGGLLLERLLLLRGGFPIGPDELVYSTIALKWLGRISPAWFVAGNRARGVAVLVAPLYWIKNVIGPFHRLPFIALSLALTGITYLIGRRLFNSPAIGAVGAVAFGLFRVNLFASVQLLPDVPAALLVALAYWIYWRAAVERTAPLWPAGAAVGLAFFFNPAYAFLGALAIAIDFLIHHRKEIIGKQAGWTAITAGIFLVPYFARVWTDHGSPAALLSKSLAGSANLGGPLPGQDPGYVQYAKWFFNSSYLFGPVVGALIIAGAVLLAVAIATGWPVPRRYASLLGLWLAVPSVGMALLFHAEERFLMASFPAYFLTAALVVHALAKLPAKAAHTTVVALAAAGLVAYGTTQYAHAVTRKQGYLSNYQLRQDVATAIHTHAQPPCRVFAFDAVLYDVLTDCTAARYPGEEAALERQSKTFTGTTYFVRFTDRERYVKQPAYLEDFLDAHAQEAFTVEGPRPDRLVRVYTFAG
jgi:hypothetical protein